jgi:hypothetical protein
MVEVTEERGESTVEARRRERTPKREELQKSRRKVV